MANEFVWLYIIIFLTIPLVRILPRIIRKIRERQPIQQEYSEETTRHWNVQNTQEPTKSTKLQSNDMMILGQMIAGAKTFESIQKYTGLPSEKLDAALQDLESRQMIRVEHKQGMLGQKVELHPTSKGLREFHN